MFHVRVEPAGWQFEARAEFTLVEAARAADVRLPTSCRNGTCRACMCRRLQGEVTYRIDWPGLSREEKQDGYILPCVAYAASDLVIDQPAASALTPATAAGGSPPA